MATEELKIVITAETQDAVNKVKAVQNSVTQLGNTTGTSKLQAGFNSSTEAAAQLQDQLQSIKNMTFVGMISQFAKLGSEFKLYKSYMADYNEMVKEAAKFLDKNSDIYKGPNAYLNWTGMADAQANYNAHIAEANDLMKAAKGTGGGMFSAIKGGALKAAAAIGVVVAAVAALVAGMKNAITTAKRMTAEFWEAQKVGLTVDAYQEWAYVLSKVGVESDKLSDFIKSLSAAQNDLRDGSEGMVNAFKQLGLSAEEAASMSQGQLFAETVKRLQQVENEVERTGIAYRIFGEDDAAQIANILRLNNQELANMVDNFYLLGGGASDSLIKKSTTLSNALGNLKLAWQGLTNTLGEWFMPMITKIINAITIAIAAINMFFRAVLGYDIIAKGSTSNNDMSVSWKSSNDAAKDYLGTVNKIKRAQMGFDELNVVSDPATSGGGSGAGAGGGFGGGGSIDMPQMDFSKMEQLQNMAQWFDEHRDAIQKWTGVVVGATTAWGLFKAGFKLFTGKEIGLFAAIGSALKAIPKFAGWLGTVIALLKEGNSLGAVMGAAFPKVAAALKGVGAFLGKIGSAIAGLGGWVVAIVAAVVAAIAFIVTKWDELKAATVSFFKEEIAPKFDRIKEAAIQLWDSLSYLLQPVIDLVKGFFEWLIPALEVLWEMIVFLGGVIVTILGSVLAGVINGIISLVTGAVEIVSGAIGLVVGIIELFVNTICAIFTGDWSGIEGAWQRICTATMTLLTGLYDGTIGVIVELVDGIIEWFTALWDELVGHSIVPDMVKAIIEWFFKLPGELFGMMGDFVKGILNKFSELATKAGEWAKKMWEGIKKPFQGVASWFKDVFQKAWEGVKNVFSTGGKIFTGIKDGIASVFKTVVNGIIDGINKIVKVPFDAINNVLKKLKSIEIVGIKPFNWVSTFNVPQIPRLAKGGITNGSVLANIGERGREAVLPLENNTGWMDMLAERIAARNNTPSRIVLMVDGRELGWASINGINGITKQTGGLQLQLV